MSVELVNRTIWITGASFGIGLELAKTLLEKDNRLIVTARSSNVLEQLQLEYPGQVSIVSCDISKSDACDYLKAELSKHAQSLDTVILNAGICEYIDVEDFDINVVERVTQTNYLGFVRCVGAALPLLRASSKNPHLVGVSSASAYIGLPRAQAYGASKAALRHFLQSLRLDLFPLGIDVSIVYPGFVDTRLTRVNDFEMPFKLSSEQAVERMVNGIEKRKKEIAFPKRLIWPIRLFSLLPATLSTELGQKLVRTQGQAA